MDDKNVVCPFGDTHGKMILELLAQTREETDRRFNELKQDTEEIKMNGRIQNGRVRKLELWRAGIVAGGAVVFVVLGWLAKNIDKIWSLIK